MARVHKVIPEKRAVIVVAWDTFTGRDLMEGIRRLGSDPTFEAHFRVVVDYRGVEKFFVSEQTLAEMGNAKISSAAAKKAFIVNSAFIGAVARMYGTMHATEKVEVFGHDGPALDWVNDGLPESEHLTSDDLRAVLAT